jgi:copper oxidase (laccase) domain-containing protein
LNRTPIESVQALEGTPGIEAHFIGRIPGLSISVERSEAMALLAPQHHRILQQSGLENFPLVTAEQIHGKEIAIVTGATTSAIQGVDALITCIRALTLGIYVADCAPVWIVAHDGSAGALVHAGKKGTELGIVPLVIEKLLKITELDSQDLIVVIGPCIRPPCYEIDFAARIREQARACGVLDIHDREICTACHPELYYSYRKEKGLTGRMLATLTLLPS